MRLPSICPLSIRLTALIALAISSLPLIAAEALSASAQHEMRLLLAEKRTEDASARKLESGLRLALQRVQQRGTAAALPRLRVTAPDARGRFHVDILLDDAAAMPALRERLQALPDADVQSAVADEIRVWLRWQDIAPIAAHDAVRRVRRAIPAMTSSVRTTAPTALNISEGVRAHAVDSARSSYGITGLGQKICVLSDSIDALGRVQSSGDLPLDIEVLPGQSGLGNGASGEGTAMLEIVHDMAPDARLGFAAAFNGVASFAQNIRDLRFVTDCDVIVDDIFYFNEPPFQDGPIAQAVNDVSADGALYFSAAGNEGNLHNGTAGVYEGDFVDAGTLAALPGGSIALFSAAGVGSSNQIRVIEPGFAVSLAWSDPLGASGNDYDLFLLSPDLQHVLDAGIDLQDGDDDPFEITSVPQANDRIVVWKATPAAPRYLHISGLRGRFNLATGGQSGGHSAAAAAYSVAAVAAFTAQGQAFTGGDDNPVEVFSSDGPRRMFFDAGGNLLNANNPSLLGDGGVLRGKPDIAAADGVSTATPGFSTFFGTSAAAPHAAAIAALLRQAVPTSTPLAIRNALTTTALDIETPGVDALSGAGIVIADAALAAIGAVPVARLQRGDFLINEIDGDGDGVPEPGETIDISITLRNDGAAEASAISATLSSASVGLSVLRSVATYPNLSAGAAAMASLPFRIVLATDYPCGRAIELALQTQFAGASPGTVPVMLQAFQLPVGAVGAVQETHYSGMPVLIPDHDVSGINVALAVNVAAATIADVDLRFNGETCSADVLATAVGLQHSFVGDLDIRLSAPDGSTVRIVDRPLVGIGDNSGNHLCQTVFDDEAEAAFADELAQSAPFSASYRGVEPMSALDGHAAQGLWQLHVADHAAADSGALRDFSLLIRPAQCDLHVPQLLHGDGFE